MKKPVISSLLLCVCLSAPAHTQSNDQWRVICNDAKAREQARRNLEGLDRRVLEWGLEFNCPRLELPTSPVHDAAETSRAASHTDWVYDAYYSADGRTILSTGKDDSLGLWDAETGKLIRRIAMPPGAAPGSRSSVSYVRSAVFVGDGARIAATKDGYPVMLFETASGARVGDLPFTAPRTDSFSFPPRMATTKSGLLFLAGENDQVLAIDVAAASVRYRLPGHGERAFAVAVSESADLVATAAKTRDAKAGPDAAQRIYLWRLGTGEKLSELTPQGRSDSDALTFSRDGSQLAVLIGGTVHVYAVKDLTLTRSIVVHPFAGFDVAFTADGTGLVTCQSHPILWDLASGEVVRHFGPFNDLCHSVDVSPDGKFVVSTSMASDLKIWEIATGKFYRRLGIDVKPPR